VAWSIEHEYLPSCRQESVTVEDYWQGWFSMNGEVSGSRDGADLRHAGEDAVQRLTSFEDNSIRHRSVVRCAHPVSASGKVVINEIDLGAFDAVELYNSSEAAVDLTGWQIQVYQNDIAPGDPPTIYTFLPRSLEAGETVTLHEAGSPLDNGTHHVYAGDQRAFNAPGTAESTGRRRATRASRRSTSCVTCGRRNAEQTPVPAGRVHGDSIRPPLVDPARDVNGRTRTTRAASATMDRSPEPSGPNITRSSTSGPGRDRSPRPRDALRIQTKALQQERSGSSLLRVAS
jgi:hypothetical protein